MRINGRNVLFNATMALNCLLCFFLIFYDHLMVPSILQVFGRAHPLLLHFPIVLFVLFLLWEWFAPLNQDISSRIFQTMSKWLLLCTAFTSVVTALMGIFLSKEPGYDPDALAWHKWTGALISLLAFCWYLFYDKFRVTKISLGSASLVSACLLILAGHAGASITHGDNFLLAPVIKEKKKPVVAFDQALVFDDMVKPILEEKCISCHNSKKAKGSLIMETKETLLKGGKDGALWDTTKVDLSLLLQRVHLPLEDKKHMSPKGKPQLTDQELAIIYNWIKGGARFDTKVKELSPTDTLRTIAEKVFSSSEEAEDYDFSSASEKTIQELNTNYRSVYPLALESPAIAVDFFGAAFFKSEQLKELLKIKTQLVSLNLDKMPVTDNDLQTIGQFTNLRKLNLSFTKITGTGLSALSNLAHLKSLALTNTPLKPDDFKNMESLKELKHLYLWNSGFSVAEMEQLKKKYPDIDIEMGSRTDTLFVKLNAPIIQNENQIITDSPVKLQLKHYVPGVTIRYTLDGTEPDSLQSLVYNDHSIVNNQVMMKAKAFKPGWHSSDMVQYQFFQATYRPDTVILLKPTDSSYRGKGGRTLNDLVKGTTNFGDGKWIAYRKNNMECMLVFSKPVNVSNITISALINLGAYIFPLKSISISGGNTATNLKPLYHSSPKQDTTTQGGYLAPYECKFPNTLVRYIKVVVAPYGKLPKPLQQPKNDLGWLFVDEIFVN